MSAYVHVVPDEDFEILDKYLAEGAVLIRQSVADEIKNKTGEDPDDLYLDEYDFGGDADVWFDVVSSQHHMAYSAILNELTNNETDNYDD